VDDPLAVALKFGFLAVLYLFLLWVSRSALRDLTRNQEAAVASEPVDAPGGRRAEPQGGGLLDQMSPHFEVIAALGRQPGEVIDLRDGATLGRGSSATINIDDPFASTTHARIYAAGDFMQLEDMGSTNGTYLNGRPVRGAERLKQADVVRIGDTEFRYGE
jgi:pSer/pThr/pTyr-binding forkhead associated (FHA) protein